jgi:N-acetylneuraminic acid mutarotase
MLATAPSIFHKTSRTAARKAAIVVLLTLATCNESTRVSDRSAITPARKSMGPAPATETAVWARGYSVTAPEGRFLQAAALDETRQVVVMFGGENRTATGGAAQPTQDLWEWSLATGSWTLRPSVGAGPDARAGAAMVFDSARNKMVLFGGRAASGYNYEDLWEWDPTTGAWSEKSNAGSHPSARAQHAMVYEASSGKILLFGGGRSAAPSSDGTSVSTSLGDTWELDPATATWTALSPATSPSVRHDFGLVWDSTRSKAVLFGGMQIDIPGATGVPKQDTWEWDPVAQTWSERTSTGSKPSQRYGHAMAFDAGRGKVVVFGGYDMSTAGVKNDLWDWDATSGAWTQRLTGSETGVPRARSYASMIYDVARSRLDLLAGQVAPDTSDPAAYYSPLGTNDAWELDPATLTFSNRSIAYQAPQARAYHAMAYDQATGKVYVFGGVNPMLKGDALTDLWEWDGSTWNKVDTAQSPPGRIDGAMAYDPARRALILFGGNSWTTGMVANDTWEWSSATRQWTRLTTNGSPDARWGHGMVTDTVRQKVLLFGGSGGSGGPGSGNEVWEWDGPTLSWSNRTPLSSSTVPSARVYPAMSYDEHRQKLLLYDGSRSPSVDGESTSAFWEWDPITTGWALRDPGDSLPDASNVYAVYDPIRRRHVFVTDASTNGLWQTWELDATSAAWYVRSLPDTPGNRFRSTMVFAGSRRVAVLFGGTLNIAPGGPANDTWEYQVSNLANGEGCTADTASSCASGYCVDGVCCESAGCSGACKSCNVPGSEGTCVLAPPGTEIPGSCSEGQACDGTGACKSMNGQPCTSGEGCASGNCTDGVCCNSACQGPCKTCNRVGSSGLCTFYAAGTDPDGDCGEGTGVCKSTCDGVGACTFPSTGVSCGTCLTCDGSGTCGGDDPACGAGGSVPGKGGAGGSVSGKAGAGGSVTSTGGAGGRTSSTSGGAGGSGGASGGGAGGASMATGGSGPAPFTGTGGVPSDAGGGNATDAGAITVQGGAGGVVSGAGGAPGLDGAAVTVDARGAGDAGLVAQLRRGGCSCELGQVTPSESTLGLWVLSIGVGAVAWRRRRRRSPS